MKKHSHIIMFFEAINRLPLHSFLFAIYMPLALLAHNLGQVDYSDGYRSIIITALLALVNLGMFRIFSKSWQQAGVVTTVIMAYLLTYGHVHTAIKNLILFDIIIGRHLYLAIIWLFLLIISLWFVTRKVSNYSMLTTILNLMSIFLLVFPIVQMVYFSVELTKEIIGAPDAAKTKTQYGIKLSLTDKAPDIYYIILDSYTRSDVMEEDFKYDNSDILNELKKMGFYIADCAQSNYSETNLSLSSSLNLNYVTAFGDSFTQDKTDLMPMWKLIQKNQVKSILESFDYKTIAFATGYDFTEIETSQIYYASPSNEVNGFENTYIRTTMLIILDDTGILRKYGLSSSDQKRKMTLDNLRILENTPLIPGPKFVFAHILVPHPPFVFGTKGEHWAIYPTITMGSINYTRQDYTKGYRNQSIFISNKMLEIIGNIIKTSEHPPIIIIQGDHGPVHYGNHARVSILNAYYFPDAQPDFYSNISPINSFRLVFNTYFNANFEMLPDISYYSDYPYIYKFNVVPSKCEVE